MPAYRLWDPPSRESLFPFTYTRPVALCRTGILTLREKWAHRLGAAVEIYTGTHFPSLPVHQRDEREDDLVWINGALIPDEALVAAVTELPPGERLVKGELLLAHRIEPGRYQDTRVHPTRSYDGEPELLLHPWDCCRLNDQEIRKDFELLTRGRQSAAADPMTRLVCPERIFIAPGARVSAAILNATDGPIYIAEGAEVMEGSLIRGPFALGEGAVVKMGAKIYGATSIGPASVVGGEINRTVVFGYSNKAHDGYLGDAVIGEWCNLGAGTSCSNLKNSLSSVKVHDEQAGIEREAGLKCGLLMGDYSRTAVNTTFYTGSLVGVSTHVFGSSIPPSYLSSFLWVGDKGIREYQLDKALAHAAAWKKLKGVPFSTQEQQILTQVFNHTSIYRKSFLHA